MTRILMAVFGLALGQAVSGQDLFDRARSSRERQPALQVEKDRSGISSRVAPDYDYSSLAKDRGSSAIGTKLYWDSDFACGKFNLKTSLANLLSQEFRDEFVQDALNAGEGYLAASALNLVCQTSPVLCNNLKHFRANANFLAALSFDRCKAWDQALESHSQRAYVRIMKDCMERLRKDNPDIPIDEAERKCKNSPEIKNLRGDLVKEINLVEDLSKYFELDPETSKQGSQILGDSKLTAQGKEEIRPGSVGNFYNARKEGYLSAWSSAFSQLSAGKGIADVNFLGPRSAKLAEDDVRALYLLPDWKRDLLVRVLASAFALYDALVRSREWDELLAQAQEKGSSDLVKGEIANLRSRLSQQLGSLGQEYQALRTLEEALLSARVESEAEVARILQGKVALLSQSLESEKVLDRFDTGWGKLKRDTGVKKANSLVGPGRMQDKCCSGPDDFRGGVYGREK